MANPNILDGINLNIQFRDFIGITGNSGVGKTTLGLVLAGILKPNQGSVLFNGMDVWTGDRSVRKSINRKLQTVFQHPETSFDPRWTIRQSLAEPYQINGIRPDLSVLEDHLAEVELDASVLDRRPHQLSGGELQRIAIARIMALKPAVVILDEPTAMLDILTQEWIMSLLEQFRKKTGVAYVLISHDIELVNRFCKQIFRLENGRLSPAEQLASLDL